MLARIQLTNYRNLSLDHSLSKQNLIVAGNGSGKTNLLEAIYLSCLGHSLKQIDTLQDLIGPELEVARINLWWDTLELVTTISSGIANQRRITLAGKPQQLSKVVGKFPVILFAPASVDLSSGEPASRRGDLDDFLNLLSTEYRSTHSRYEKMLDNRNAVLKHFRGQNSYDASQLEYWDQELSSLGAKILQLRLEFFAEVTPYIKQQAQVCFGNKQVEFELIYDTEIDTSNPEADLLGKLQSNHALEVANGKTMWGVHRDDYSFLLNGKSVRFFGSRGQQRLAVFVYKLAQAQFLEAKLQNPPLLLVDDLLSELDSKHRTRVGEILAGLPWQFILTASDNIDVPKNMQTFTKLELLGAAGE